MSSSKDRLSLAVKLGALGNVIDFGTPTRLSLEDILHKSLEKDLTVFHMKKFRKELDSAQNIVVLGDNTGEIVLDSFLLKELKSMGKQLIYGVREGTVINDATMDDAMEAGLDKFATLITTGSRAPGTLLSQANLDLKNALSNADLIISKGQGNYECLSADPMLKKMQKQDTSIFYLLTVKCPYVAEYAGVTQGSTIFKMG